MLKILLASQPLSRCAYRINVYFSYKHSWKDNLEISWSCLLQVACPVETISLKRQTLKDEGFVPVKEKQWLQKGVIYMKGRKIKGSRTVRLSEFPSCSFLILLGYERLRPGSIESAHFNSGSLKTDTAVMKVRFMSFLFQKNKLLVRHRIFW